MVKKTITAKTKAIPAEIKAQADAIVKEFNEKVIRNPNYHYVTRYKGNYLYLDIYRYGQCGPICRLTYTGDMLKWEFAIYRYSKEFYDPNEWMFPGSNFVDGTIQGAMKAGLKAYP
jgi:hypothetical protein